MATGQMTRVVHQLRRVVLRRDGAGLTDGQLLEAFLAGREEAAFEALVRRHGAMVLNVCRRVLRHAQDAEDAFQATFLVLVRKAASIRPRERVGHWLYGVAYRTALKARSRTARRCFRERQVLEMPQPERRAESTHDWRPLLDRELNRLPDKYRALIVLADLEGKSRKELARQLDLPEGTVSSRLARARRLLAKRLARQGITLSAGTLAAAIAPPAEAGVPPLLLAVTVQATTHLAADSAATVAGVSASVATLTEGVLTAMFLTKLKIVVALVLGAAILGTSTGLLTHQALAGKAAAQKPGAQPGKKGKAETGPSIEAVVKTVDPTTNGILVAVNEKGQKKNVEKTFTLAKDAKVMRNDGLRKGDPGQESRLANLTAGTQVVLQLSADQKTVLGITVGPAAIHATVKAVDPTSNTINVTYKDSTGLHEQTFPLSKEAKVLLNDGLVKGFQDQVGKLADLTEGMPVVLKISALDQKTVLDVRVQGQALHGTVKGVDVGNNTITVTVKENAGLEDKTLSVVKNARIDGNLGDIAPGTRVVVQLSVFDKTKAVAIHPQKQE